VPSHVDYSMKSIDLLQKTLMGRLGALADLSGVELGLIQADAALGAPRNRLLPTLSRLFGLADTELLWVEIVAASRLSSYQDFTAARLRCWIANTY